MSTPNQTIDTVSAIRHRGPNLAAVAIVFTLLKLASLFPVTTLGIATGFNVPISRRTRHQPRAW
jgi:hypothetical protein